MKSNPINEEEICRRYIETNDGISKMAIEYHVDKSKIKKCLLEHGIEIKKKGKQPLRDVFVVNDWKIEKYPEKDGVYYVAVDKETGYECNDVYNRGGHLTTYIEQKYGVPTPTLYDRRLYYMRTGNYWWEQWFTIEERRKKETKKCKFCDWETEDIFNMSGAYEVHLRKCHNITKNEYLEKFPEEKPYFALVSPVLNRQMSNNTDEFVICKVCGKKMGSLNANHLRKHGLTKYSYFEKYGIQETISKNFHDKCSENAKLTNMNSVFHKTSKAEDEISDFIKSLGFEVEQSTRRILEGKEMDIYIPSIKTGFEFNGLYFHTENYGKTQFYHQRKTNLAESKGVNLYQIFEDEYIHKKDVLFSKIRHILGKDNGTVIEDEHCKIRTIDGELAVDFLMKYDIQYPSKYDTLYLGAFYEENLIGVVSLTEELPNVWNLTRFATNYHYSCNNMFSNFISYFTQNYNYYYIKRYCDRRWNTISENKKYIELGFEIEKILPPSYSLFLNKHCSYRRHNPNSFHKNELVKVFDFDKNLTLKEMLNKLGYKRIWDCGLIKYVYRNPNAPQPETSKSEAQ